MEAKAAGKKASPRRLKACFLQGIGHGATTAGATSTASAAARAAPGTAPGFVSGALPFSPGGRVCGMLRIATALGSLLPRFIIEAQRQADALPLDVDLHDFYLDHLARAHDLVRIRDELMAHGRNMDEAVLMYSCLLYTSDAADE